MIFLAIQNLTIADGSNNCNRYRVTTVQNIRTASVFIPEARKSRLRILTQVIIWAELFYN